MLRTFCAFADRFRNISTNVSYVYELEASFGSRFFFALQKGPSCKSTALTRGSLVLARVITSLLRLLTRPFASNRPLDTRQRSQHRFNWRTAVATSSFASAKRAHVKQRGREDAATPVFPRPSRSLSVYPSQPNDGAERTGRACSAGCL